MARRDAIQIEGVEELKKTLLQMMPREVGKILRNAVGAVAGELRDEIRANMPAHVRHYRTAIQVYRPRLGRGVIAADVVAKRTPPRAFYLHNIVEHGARNRFTKAGVPRGSVPAFPFKEPVVERWRNSGRIAEAFDRAIGTQIELAWARRKGGNK